MTVGYTWLPGDRTDDTAARPAERNAALALDIRAEWAVC